MPNACAATAFVILGKSIATPAGEAPAPGALCARYKNQYAETDISTQQSQARQDARISRAHEDERRTGRAVAPPGPRPPQADRERREGRPLRQGQLIRRFRRCAPLSSAKSMTMARAFPARCSRPSVWRVPRAANQVRDWASLFRARSAEALSGTGLSAACAKRSGCIAANSIRTGTSCSILAVRPSRRHSRNSSRVSGE